MILLKELLDSDLPLACPAWLSTQFWILQFDEEFFKIAKKLWNRYGMVLRTQVIDLSQEKQNMNIYNYLRSNNQGIFEASIKSLVAAIELYHTRLDFIVDDLIEFYNSEMAIIEKTSLIAM